MSIYGNILFERKYKKFCRGIKEHDIFYQWSVDLRDDIISYNQAKKVSRRVSRLRDIFWDIAYNIYHWGTDEPYIPDREQMYHFGKMEMFI